MESIAKNVRLHGAGLKSKRYSRAAGARICANTDSRFRDECRAMLEIVSDACTVVIRKVSVVHLLQFLSTPTLTNASSTAATGHREYQIYYSVS